VIKVDGLEVTQKGENLCEIYEPPDGGGGNGNRKFKKEGGNVNRVSR